MSDLDKATQTVNELKQKVDEAIGKLPPELQESARLYLGALLAMTRDEIMDLVQQWSQGSVESAYLKLIRNMDVMELGLELDRINRNLKDLNYTNYTFVEVQRECVLKAITTALSLLATLLT